MAAGERSAHRTSPGNRVNQIMSNSTNNAARRAFINLTKKASFIATLAASSIAFAQDPAAKPADNKAQVKANVGQALKRVNQP